MWVALTESLPRVAFHEIGSGGYFLCRSDEFLVRDILEVVRIANDPAPTLMPDMKTGLLWGAQLPLRPTCGDVFKELLRVAGEVNARPLKLTQEVEAATVDDRRCFRSFAEPVGRRTFSNALLDAFALLRCPPDRLREPPDVCGGCRLEHPYGPARAFPAGSRRRPRGTSMNEPLGGQRRLPNRRVSTTFDIEHAGLKYTATISRFGDGSLGELFVCNHKAGSASDVAARDAGILVSLCLQHGCSVERIARALSRNTDGSASGVIGAVLDRIAGGKP